MKRILFMAIYFVVAIMLSAQRYDYDDIYFNPDKDLQHQVVENEYVIAEEADDTNNPKETDDQIISYTDRINMFHRVDTARNNDKLAHIADPNYTTNVFVLSDGQYIVDVDGNSIEITENYNYPMMDWSGIYWTNRWYYGPSYYGWYRPYSWYIGWGWYGGFYDPWYSWGNPWYWDFGGYWHPYYHHHHHHHYPNYPNYGSGGGSHWWGGDYARHRASENERRSVNRASRNTVTNVNTYRSSRYSGNVSSSRETSTNRPRSSSVNTERRSSNTNPRAITTTTPRAVRDLQNSSTVKTTATPRRNNATDVLPMRPSTNGRREINNNNTRVNTKTTTRQTTVNNRHNSSTNRHQTYTPSRSSTTTRSSTSVRSLSTPFGRSGSGSSSTRRR